MARVPKSFDILRKSAYGKVLSEYLAECILELNTLDDIDFSKKEKGVIEGRARQLASKKLTEILSTLLTDQESTTIKRSEDDLSMMPKDTL